MSNAGCPNVERSEVANLTPRRGRGQFACAILAVVGLLAAGCPGETTDDRFPATETARAQGEERGAGEARTSTGFRSTDDLLDAIEEGVSSVGDDVTDARLSPPDVAAPPPVPVPDPVLVRFQSGTRVPESAKPELEAFTRAVSALPEARIDLVGCSDPSGPVSVNLRISKARAESVATLLGSLGVPAEQIGDVIGRGEDCTVQERVVHVTVTQPERS